MACSTGLLRIENEKVAEMWVEWDNFNILMQLGHITPESLFSPDSTPQDSRVEEETE